MEIAKLVHTDTVIAPHRPLRPPAHLAAPDRYPRLRGTIRNLRIQNRGADAALGFAVAMYALATTDESRDVALALGDLLVTGRRAHQKWLAAGLEHDPVDAILGALPPGARALPRAQLVDAHEALITRVREVGAHLDSRKGRRAAFAPKRGSKWIASYAEQDVARAPVNVGCTAFVQEDLIVSLPRHAPLDVRFVRSGELDAHSKIVLYLHGLGSRAEEADALATELAALDPRYVVIAPDLASHGSTSRIALLAGSGLDVRYDVGASEDSPSGYPFLEQMEAFVVAFVDALDQKLPGAKSKIVCLAGGSLGGTLTLRLGLTTSEWQPRTLAVWSPAGLWDPMNADLMKKHFAVEQVLDIAKMPEMLDEGSTASGLVPLARPRFFSFNFEDQSAFQKAGYRFWWSERFLRKHGEAHKDAAIADRLEHYGEAYRRWQFRLAYEQLCFSFRRGGRIAKIGVRPNGERVPMLLLCGEEDNHMGAHIADRMKDLAKAKASHPGRAVWIENAGHSLHDECPGLLATELHSFLSKHG